MKIVAPFLISSAIILTGCHTAKKVAVTSFKVVDAPANYIRHKIDDDATTTTTTTTTSDVANPGYVVTEPAPQTGRPPVTTLSRPPSTTPVRPNAESQATAPTRKPAPSATPRVPTQTTQFPTARPVPGRPGYVYSLDPNGGMIDVTGYKSGDRAKDPYTKQVFIVP